MLRKLTLLCGGAALALMLAIPATASRADKPASTPPTASHGKASPSAHALCMQKVGDAYKTFVKDQAAALKAFNKQQRADRKALRESQPAPTEAQLKALHDSQKTARSDFHKAQKAARATFHEQQEAARKAC